MMNRLSFSQYLKILKESVKDEPDDISSALSDDQRRFVTAKKDQPLSFTPTTFIQAPGGAKAVGATTREYSDNPKATLQWATDEINRSGANPKLISTLRNLRDSYGNISGRGPAEKRQRANILRQIQNMRSSAGPSSSPSKSTGVIPQDRQTRLAKMAARVTDNPQLEPKKKFQFTTRSKMTHATPNYKGKPAASAHKELAATVDKYRDEHPSGSQKPTENQKPESQKPTDKQRPPVDDRTERQREDDSFTGDLSKPQSSRGWAYVQKLASQNQLKDLILTHKVFDAARKQTSVPKQGPESPSSALARINNLVVTGKIKDTEFRSVLQDLKKSKNYLALEQISSHIHETTFDTLKSIDHQQRQKLYKDHMTSDAVKFLKQADKGLYLDYVNEMEEIHDNLNNMTISQISALKPEDSLIYDAYLRQVLKHPELHDPKRTITTPSGKVLNSALFDAGAVVRINEDKKLRQYMTKTLDKDDTRAKYRESRNSSTDALTRHVRSRPTTREYEKSLVSDRPRLSLTGPRASKQKEIKKDRQLLTREHAKEVKLAERISKLINQLKQKSLSENERKNIRQEVKRLKAERKLILDKIDKISRRLDVLTGIRS